MQKKTHLNPTNPFATKFSTPILSAGKPTFCTTYLSTKTVTPPAMPPAKLAKPKKRTTRAFQATPDPLYEKLSDDSRAFSTLLMINIPKVEKMKGSQSMKRMWMSEALSGEWDQTAESRRV